MIRLYTDTTPNGYRASIILEEAGLAYEAIRVDHERGEQHKAEFVALNPAAAIPVLVDDDGPAHQPLVLPQSGAIMTYVAEKCGRFIPRDPWRRAQMHRWFFQVATDITSTSSWIHNQTRNMPVKSDENLDWLQSRLKRALRVTDQWLAEHEYFADEISIADFLFYPNFWFRRSAIEKGAEFPNLLRWGDRLAARPGVGRGMAIFR